MDGLYISISRSVVDISSLKCCSSWVISHKLSQVSLFVQVTYLLFQLETIFSIMVVISMKLIILVLISS